MASLSVKDRLAAMKAKLEATSNIASASTVASNNNMNETTTTSNSSSKNQSTTVSPPPPHLVQSSASQDIPPPPPPATISLAVENNNNNNNNTSSIASSPFVTPTFVQKHFPSYIYTSINPKLDKHGHEYKAVLGLAQAQYLSSLMSRVENPETTPEGVRPTAKSFILDLINNTTSNNNNSSMNESGSRRQREDENGQTSKSNTTVIFDFGGNNNNNNNSSPKTNNNVNNNQLHLSVDGQRMKRKQDIGFLGVTPSQRKCEDVNEKYETGSAISEGVFGVVYRGNSKKNGQPFALKKIKDNWFTESKEGFPHYLLRELDLCLRLKHEYTMEGVECASNRPTEKEYQLAESNSNTANTTPITASEKKFSSMKSPFIGDVCSQVAAATPGIRPSLFLVTEYGGRNLRHEITRLSRPFDMAAVKHIMLEILQGMNYLHQNFIIHRDLKPSNILVNDAGTVKICDWGLARCLRSNNNTNRRQLSTNVVTLFYRAPELHFGASDYHAAIDVWSIGCIFAELLTGNPLFVAHEADLHLQEVCRIVGIPTEESFPGFTLFPLAMKSLSTVTVKSEDIATVKQQQQQPQNGAVGNLSKHGLVRSVLLQKFVRGERSKLFSADDAGEKLQKDPKYCVTDSCLELLDWMLQWSPKVRITCEEALRHPFFTEEGTPAAAAFDIEQRRQYSRFLQQQQQQQQQQQSSQQ